MPSKKRQVSVMTMPQTRCTEVTAMQVVFLILMLLAVLSFVSAAFGYTGLHGINLMAAGLGFWALAVMVNAAR